MTWQVDYSHTAIQFSVRHMMISTVRGEFEKFKIETALDDPQIEKLHAENTLSEQDFLDAHLTVEIDAASVNTRAADRDTHLRSPDFLMRRNIRPSSSRRRAARKLTKSTANCMAL